MRIACVVMMMTAGAAMAAEPNLDRAGPLKRQWYTPQDLLSRLAERDGLKWALPETLAGLGMAGGDGVTAGAALDEACKGWGLEWTVANGVVVVHRPSDDKLKMCTTALAAGGENAVDAAWELGWLRDARAVPDLAKALASDEPAVALAAAAAVETLDKRIPLGRTERVDPILPGRVSVAAAFPPTVDLTPLLDSPYPPIRAAAVRLLLGQGGTLAETARARTVDDHSTLVQQVRQQMLFERPKKGDGAGDGADLPPMPDTPEAVKAAAREMLDKILPLEKKSEWAQMRKIAATLAAWARTGSEPATEALLELSRTKAQRYWYPGLVVRHMADVGGPAVEARLKEAFRAGDRDLIVRGLERRAYGEDLAAYTGPFLGSQTVAYVTARKAGRAAYDDFLALAPKAGKGRYAAVDVLGVIGGRRAVAALTTVMAKDEPNESTLAFRGAKALGRTGQDDALTALLAATTSPVRARRHAATLFLGRIGGPKAEAELLAVLKDETDRLVRAAAATALEEIGTETALAAAADFRKADAGPPPLVYQPRNKRFGPEFPVNTWVDLDIRIRAYDNFGEMGWNYDAANHLFFRYGGCSGYTNELTVFDLGTEKFVQRRPNEEVAGFDDRRPPRGCSAGRTWDPYNKTAWIGPAIGGTYADVAIHEYYNKAGGYSLSSYDLATDRFRAAVKAPNTGRYVYDWKHGLLLPVKFTHPVYKTKDWEVFDTRDANPYTAAAWKDKTNPAGDYPFASSHRYTIAAVDQASGVAVVFVPPHTDRSTRKQYDAETWTYNPAANTWKNVSPKVQPDSGVWGAGFVYDPFNKVLILHSGKTKSQYGGPKDAVTWSYDLRTNAWTDLKPEHPGPGNPWVGAMAFDPEHNAIVLFNYRDKHVYAYRYKNVAVGTRANLGGDEAE